MVKAIVFDCYGVLVGSSFWDIYREAGGDTQKDEAFIDEMLARANAALISTRDFSRAIADRIGISEEKWLACTKRMEQPNEALFTYIQQRLKPQYKIGLLSNANKHSVENRIPAAQRKLLDAIVVSGEVGYMKPDPEIFELTAQKLGVAYSDMVFVDDLADYVAAAKRLGIHAIQYVGFDRLRQDLEALLQS